MPDHEFSNCRTPTTEIDHQKFSSFQSKSPGLAVSNAIIVSGRGSIVHSNDNIFDECRVRISEGNWSRRSRLIIPALIDETKLGKVPLLIVCVFRWYLRRYTNVVSAGRERTKKMILNNWKHPIMVPQKVVQMLCKRKTWRPVEGCTCAESFRPIRYDSSKRERKFEFDQKTVV